MNCRVSILIQDCFEKFSFFFLKPFCSYVVVITFILGVCSDISLYIANVYVRYNYQQIIKEESPSCRLDLRLAPSEGTIECKGLIFLR